MTVTFTVIFSPGLEYELGLMVGPRGRLWPVLLYVIRKEGLYPSSGGFNRQIMMMIENP
jgi:hypothetical protein